MVKEVKDSEVVMTEMVLPNDTNVFNNLMGGRLMYLMDIVAAISAQKHSNNVVVTASVDHVSFHQSIRLGDVITLKGKITRAFNTSMEIFIEVFAENIPEGTKVKSNEAYFTMVAIDENGKPKKVPQVIYNNEVEKQASENALKRRQLRLLQAGKIEVGDIEDIKSLFKF